MLDFSHRQGVPLCLQSHVSLIIYDYEVARDFKAWVRKDVFFLFMMNLAEDGLVL